MLPISPQQAIQCEAKEAGQGGEQHIVQIARDRSQPDYSQQSYEDWREAAKCGKRRSG
jgi:hypothetical protein